MSAQEPASCPVLHTATGARSNRDWWPNQLNLDVLHKHSPASDPMGEHFEPPWV